VKEPREDDERLSALLEGRVEGRQREDMLAHLAAADEDYEVFTDTAAVLRALEEEDARARRGPVPPSMRKRGWVRTAAYAVSAVVVLLAISWALRERGGSAGASPLQLAMRADPDAAGLRTGWAIPAPSDPPRGEDRAATNALAVRAGAMLVDLSVAVLAGDLPRARQLAGQALDDFEPGAGPRAPLRRIAEAGPDTPRDSLNALVNAATDRLAALGRKPLEVGAWAEAARIAAAARNAGFFQDDAGPGMLDHAEDLATDDDARRAVAQVREVLPANGAPPRWVELEERLGTLLSELSD
jgi:hypothetical protein